MGIWHSVSLDNQKETTFTDTMSAQHNSFQQISLDDQNGYLGLHAYPNTYTYLYPAKHTEKVNIALDGHIDNKQTLCSKLDMDEDDDIGSVIVSLYETYGLDGLYELEGPFSLILYDKQKKLTLLYSSFLTGYPLYYLFQPTP